MDMGSFTLLEYREHKIKVNKKTYTYRINYPIGTLNNSDLNVIFYSNPENSREKEYRPVMERLASWGYIVIGNNDAKTSYSGEVLAKVIKDFTRKYSQIKKIGIVGIKLGASGAIKALNNLFVNNNNNITISALYLCELYSQAILEKLGKISILMIQIN